MVKSKIKITIKLVLFVIVICTCVSMVNEWMKPKYYYTEDWPSTNTYMDFYKLERNTVDVLFFGSSHAVSSFNPQVIYDDYGITSYNLGSEQQSLLVTYFWLREALKYQSPKAIVLDTYTFHKYRDAYIYNNMNCSEESVRKAMDSMRFSPLKVEASMAIEKVDPTHIGLSFLLLNIRYHSRWTSLGENDYTENEMINHGGIKGFSALNGTEPGKKEVTFKDSDLSTAEAEPMVEIADEYLDKIVELCKKEGIELILVNIPCGESINRYKTTKEFADKNNLPYYDLNEEKLYNDIGYNAEKYRYGHPNYLGAEVISRFIGELLLDDYNIPTRKDKSYDQSRINYENRIDNIKLIETVDVNKYLEELNNSRYSVFALVPANIGDYIDDEFLKRWNALGFTNDIKQAKDGTHYCAVKSDGKTMEKCVSEDLDFSGSIRNGVVQYRFTIDTKKMTQKGHKYSMVVNGTECGNTKAGLDIVVYDNEYKKIIDKVNIDTTVEERTFTRD